MLVEVGTHRGDHHGEVLGLAPRHHRVDSGVLGGDGDLAGRHGAEHIFWGESGHGQERLDLLRRRRHHREAVGPTPFEGVLEERIGVGPLLAPGVQHPATLSQPPTFDSGATTPGS